MLTLLEEVHADELLFPLSLLPTSPCIPNYNYSATEPPHPHPFAPKEYAKAFSQEASGASSTPKSSKGGAVAEFWEAPERFWRPRIRELQDWEIEAITVRLRHCWDL